MSYPLKPLRERLSLAQMRRRRERIERRADSKAGREAERAGVIMTMRSLPRERFIPRADRPTAASHAGHASAGLFSAFMGLFGLGRAAKLKHSPASRRT